MHHRSHRSHRRAGLAAATAIAALSFAAASAPAPGAVHRGVSAWDAQWLMGAIQGDRFEVAGGRLAAAKGTTPQVRALGARLVADHGKSLKEAVRLARSLGVEVPRTPTPSQEWEIQAVGMFSGLEFDRQYAMLEVQDHKQDIDEAKAEVRKGSRTLVRAAARKELPTLRRHLKLSRAALDAAVG